MSETKATKPDDPLIEHVHFGAGTFGLGMVVEICHGEAGLKTAVVNRESEREYHRILKSKGSYSVLLDSDVSRQKILKPSLHYYTAETEGTIVDLLANPSVALVTTSVKKGNLGKIAHLLARGLAKRAPRKANAQKLCIVACENLPNNSAELQRCVETYLAHDQIGPVLKDVFFCNTLVDRICAPISCRTGSVQIPIESFHLWIVQAPSADLEVLDLLRGKSLIELAASEAEFKAHETQKYWCMNGVHLATAAYAYNQNNYLKHFSQALANRDIAVKIKALQKELLVAFSFYVGTMGLRKQFTREMGDRYNEKVFQRLKRNHTDTIARVLKLEEGAGAITELLDRIQRLIKPQCQILAQRKGLVSPKDETIALHPPAKGPNERLELDDALQQVLFALMRFARDTGAIISGRLPEDIDKVDLARADNTKT